MVPERYNAYIYAGGSIFMEGGKVYNLDEGCNRFIKECYKKNIPFFYVSPNFGPYKTQKYFNLALNTFKYCTDICFRDRYSFKLFEDIPTVRYAPDLIFNINYTNINTIKDTIGISIIDMGIRNNLKRYEENYIKCMVYNIIEYIKQNKTVYLFSFCKEENDEETINYILNKIPEEYKNKVEAVYYDGDIINFIHKYTNMEYMIACRFHAMILSTAFKQKMYVLSYSKKIDNVIKDLDLVEKYSIIENLEKDTVIDLKDFKMIQKQKISEIKELSKKQLLKIDEWIVNV